MEQNKNEGTAIFILRNKWVAFERNFSSESK